MIGDASQAVIQMRWWRPRSARFDAADWVRRRAKRIAGAHSVRSDGPAPTGFESTAWIPAGSTRKTTARSIWYGYAPAARVVIEAVVNTTVPAPLKRAAEKGFLRSLRAAAIDEPTRWAVFGSSFETPAGYRLRRQSLKLGDQAIELLADGGRRLVVRQVYPSDLALTRRPLDKWLSSTSFKERRFFVPTGDAWEWEVEIGGRDLQGLMVTGEKRLPWPLGPITAKVTAAAVLHDEETGRLLLAEYDEPTRRPDAIAGMREAEREQALTEAFTGMNWAESNADGDD